jgi:DNA-binding transcriptional regulator/RsmH inhibitor MraZ
VSTELFGKWSYIIDQRGRVPIPSSFRKYFKKEVIIFSSKTKICLYPKRKDWMISEDLFVVNTDRFGRILIPLSLRRSRPGLSGKIEWVGEGDHLSLNILNDSVAV